MHAKVGGCAAALASGDISGAAGEVLLRPRLHRHHANTPANVLLAGHRVVIGRRLLTALLVGALGLLLATYPLAIELEEHLCTDSCCCALLLVRGLSLPATSY